MKVESNFIPTRARNFSREREHAAQAAIGNVNVSFHYIEPGYACKEGCKPRPGDKSDRSVGMCVKERS
jgi:hypothetical protein